MPSRRLDSAIAFPLNGQYLKQTQDNAMTSHNAPGSALFGTPCYALSTGHLSYRYTWQGPDLTALNASYTTSSDGTFGSTDVDDRSLPELATTEHKYESFQKRPSSRPGESYAQNTLGMNPLALQRQPSPPRVSRTSTCHKCFEHGCGGRSFSSSSNLRRHQRERARLTKFLPCPLCGAQFYRRWSRNQHVTRASCLRRTPKTLSLLNVDQKSQYGQCQPSRNNSNVSLMPDWTPNHAFVSPGLVVSAPVSPLSRSRPAPNNGFDPGWEALSCYWPSLTHSDSPETFDWTVRSYPGTPAHRP